MGEVQVDDVPRREKRWGAGVHTERGSKTTNATDRGAVGGRRAMVQSRKIAETGGLGRARIFLIISYRV